MAEYAKTTNCPSVTASFNFMCGPTPFLPSQLAFFGNFKVTLLDSVKKSQPDAPAKEINANTVMHMLCGFMENIPSCGPVAGVANNYGEKWC